MCGPLTWTRWGLKGLGVSQKGRKKEKKGNFLPFRGEKIQK
jgi:hypothetical protein